MTVYWRGPRPWPLQTSTRTTTRPSSSQTVCTAIRTCQPTIWAGAGDRWTYTDSAGHPLGSPCWISCHRYPCPCPGSRPRTTAAWRPTRVHRPRCTTQCTATTCPPPTTPCATVWARWAPTLDCRGTPPTRVWPTQDPTAPCRPTTSTPTS